jgi:ABC-type nitrate/sulfonate/bicarbonate transport system ATPase subunit/ABC-type nitrate/sulfonate/bicarbonate transport system permease component
MDHSETPGGKARRTLRLASATGVAGLLVIWAVASFAAGSYLVPAPWTTLADTIRLLAQSFAWGQVVITLGRVCVGFFAGFAIGLIVGLASGSRPGMGAFFGPIVQFFQGMPPLLWAIPLVALMGIGHLPAVTVIGLITFPLVAVTVGEGMTTLPRLYGEMLTLFAPGFLPRLRELILPHLRPFLAASLNAGLVLAIKASVTAEYFGAANGIGFQIQSSYMALQIRALFSWATVLILVILAFTHFPRLLARLEPSMRRLGSVIHSPRPAAYRFQPAGRRPKSRIHAPGAARLPTPASPSAPIRLRGIGFSWQGSGALLANVSLAVRPGQVAVISGDSGIGKTTLLMLVAGLLKPERGSLSCPERVGFMFQDDRLLPWRNVEDNVALPLRYSGFSREQARCIARELLGEVGLAGAETKTPAALSGGMKKRAALARCFARAPDAILMDEPFTGLHSEARRGLWALLLRLLSRHPIPAVVVTHYPREIEGADECAVYRLVGRPARLVLVGQRSRRARTGHTE